MARRGELMTSMNVSQAVKRLDQAATTQPIATQGDATADNKIRVVKDDNGNFVWEVTMETPQERMARLDERYRRVLQLADQKDALFDNNAIQYDPHKKDPVEILREKKGKYDPHVITLSNIKRAFSGFDYGPKGLVPKDSEDAKKFKLATDAVRAGRVVLPTVTEYNKQKEERRKKEYLNG